MKLRAFLLGSAMAPCLAALSVVSASAQATDAGPAATGLAEIVVTARKTAETLVHAPVSVTALSGEDLKARDITNYIGLQNYTPGFKFINQSVNRNDRGYSSFIMRGMNPGTPVSKDQAVSVFLDGVPLAGGVIDGLTDVDHVEVVKGPQSAYFGRSTFAGAVNFILREPTEDGGAAFEAMRTMWDFTVGQRDPATSLDRAAELFLERIRPMPFQAWPYVGVWSYEAEARLPQLELPVLVLQPHEPLLEHSRAAAGLIREAAWVEFPGLERDVFEAGVSRFAQAIRSWAR